MVNTARNTHTSLNYGRLPANGKPYQWINEPTGGEKRTNVEESAYPWQINDLRAGDLDYGLDKTGFDAIDFKSKTTYETCVRSLQLLEMFAMLTIAAQI